MGSIDAAVSRDDAQDVLSGQLAPEHFAYRVVPAPRVLRASRFERMLDGSSVALVAATVSIIMAAVLLTSRHHAWESVAGWWAFLPLALYPVVRAIRALANALGHGLTAKLEIDSRYRELSYAEFLKQLEDGAQERPTPPEAPFVQAAIEGIRLTLTHVGVPNTQVCILRRGVGDGSTYVSYYAGYDQPRIERGAIIGDLAAVGSRRVVYRIPCPLDADEHEDMQQLAVVATCEKLSDHDKKFVQRAVSILTAACASTSVQ